MESLHSSERSSFGKALDSKHFPCGHEICGSKVNQASCVNPHERRPMKTIRALTLVTVLAAVLIVAAGHGIAAPEPAQSSAPPFTQDRVIAHLNQTLAWYRH